MRLRAGRMLRGIEVRLGRRGSNIMCCCYSSLLRIRSIQKFDHALPSSVFMLLNTSLWIARATVSR